MNPETAPASVSAVSLWTYKMELIRNAITKAIENDHRSPRRIALDCKMNPKSVYKVLNGDQVAGHVYESLVLNLKIRVRPRTRDQKRDMEKKRKILRKVLET